VYTEHPIPQQLWVELQMKSIEPIYHHAAGYDVAIPQVDTSVPAAVRTTLMLDGMTSKYDYIVVGLRGTVEDDDLATLVERANQVLVVSTPSLEGLQCLDATQARLRRYVRPSEKSVLAILNHPKREHEAAGSPPLTDFAIPHLPETRPLSLSE